MKTLLRARLSLILCLAAGLGLFLVFSIPALAQITVSNPQILDATDFTTPGAWQNNGFGECFYLLPGPVVPGDEEPVGPDFYKGHEGQYESNTCFGAGDPTIDVIFPENIDWRIFRGDPDEAAFAFTAAPTPADDIQEKAKQNPGCLAGGVLNGPRGTTWDDGDTFTGVEIKPPMASELKLDFNGRLTLAYYFVNGEAPVLGGTKFEECRTQDFILSVFPSVGGPVTKTGTVGEFSMGKYVVFELDGLEGETLLRFETAPSTQDLCSGLPSGLGTTCTPDNFPDCDYVPAENDVLSGVFLSNCTPRGITRTLGYWKNHPTVIDGSFDGPGGFPSLLPLDFCGEDIVEPCDAVAFLSTGGGGIDNFKRQGMAAHLNCNAFGCPGDIFDLIQDGSAACGSGDSFAFGSAAEVLDEFNNSGDDFDLPFQSPPAQPKFCNDNGNGNGKDKDKNKKK